MSARTREKQEKKRMQSRWNKGNSRICVQEHEKNKEIGTYKADENRKKEKYVCKNKRKARKNRIQSGRK